MQYPIFMENLGFSDFAADKNVSGPINYILLRCNVSSQELHDK